LLFDAEQVLPLFWGGDGGLHDLFMLLNADCFKAEPNRSHNNILYDQPVPGLEPEADLTSELV
jgi:hypothetical protein